MTTRLLNYCWAFSLLVIVVAFVLLSLTSCVTSPCTPAAVLRDTTAFGGIQADTSAHIRTGGYCVEE